MRRPPRRDGRLPRDHAVGARERRRRRRRRRAEAEAEAERRETDRDDDRAGGAPDGDDEPVLDEPADVPAAPAVDVEDVARAADELAEVQSEGADVETADAGPPTLPTSADDADHVPRRPARRTGTEDDARARGTARDGADRLRRPARRAVRPRPRRPRRRRVPRARPHRERRRGPDRRPRARDAARVRHEQRVARAGVRRRPAHRARHPDRAGRGHDGRPGRRRGADHAARPGREGARRRRRRARDRGAGGRVHGRDVRRRRARGRRAGLRARGRVAAARRGRLRGPARRVARREQPRPQPADRARLRPRQRVARGRGPGRDRRHAGQRREAGADDVPPGGRAGRRARVLVIGDRLDTDLAGARSGGYVGLHVLTGVSSARDAVLAHAGERPHLLGADLLAVLEPHPEPQRVRRGLVGHPGRRGARGRRRASSRAVGHRTTTPSSTSCARPARRCGPPSTRARLWTPRASRSSWSASADARRAAASVGRGRRAAGDRDDRGGPAVPLRRGPARRGRHDGPTRGPRDRRRRPAPTAGPAPTGGDHRTTTGDAAVDEALGAARRARRAAGPRARRASTTPIHAALQDRLADVED